MAVAASRVDPFSVEPPPGERIAAKPTKNDTRANRLWMVSARLPSFTLPVP